MIKAFKSNRIYCEDGIYDGYLLVEDEKVIGFSDECLTDYEVINFQDKRIIPGIVDTHNHGTYGYLLEDITVNGKAHVKGYLKSLASQGVTGVFPTCSSFSDFPSCSIAMLKTIAEVAEEDNDGATILGIHSEGPWLKRAGEKGGKVIVPDVDIDVAKKMVLDSNGWLKLVAVSPEIVDIKDTLDFFKTKGIILAFAHSDMYYKEATEAIKGNLTVATHLGNVMTGLHHRDVGGLGACLLNDDMTYEIICDGHHVSLEMLRIFFMIHDYDRFMMISDSSGMAGAPVGRYVGYKPGMTMNIAEDGYVTSDEGRVCGSSKSVLYGTGNLVEKLDIGLEDVIKMSSLNPCKKYGFDKEKGSLKMGKDADFVVIDEDYSALYTYVKGKKVYDHLVDTDLLNYETLNRMKEEVHDI